MPTVLAFRQLRSGTRAFRYQTWSSYSGTGLVPASAYLFIPVTLSDTGLTGCRIVWHLNDFMKVESDEPYRWWKGIHPERPHTAVSGWCLKIINKCRKKVSSAYMSYSLQRIWHQNSTVLSFDQRYGSGSTGIRNYLASWIRILTDDQEFEF